MSDQFKEMGPIDYLVVEFPQGSLTGAGLAMLPGLVDRGIIRILDMQFIRKHPGGSVTVVDVDDPRNRELGVFRGASAGLLDAGDLAEAANALEPGCAAVVLVYENLWAAPLATALRRNGAQLVGGGRIPIQGILAALEAAESRTGTDVLEPVSTAVRG
jgi:hypothetical protein